MTNSPNEPDQQPPSGSQPPPPPEMPQAPPAMPAYPQADQAPGQAGGAQGQPAYPHGQPAQQYGYADPRTAKNWMGITALILTLTSLIFGITVIGGIILGHMSVNAEKRGEATNGTMGRWGMILGYVFFGLWVLLVIGLVVLALASA